MIRKNQIYLQLQNYLEFCTAVKRMSPATIQSKTYILNNFISETGLTDLRKINNQHIYHWIKVQKARGNSGRSVNVRLAHLCAMLRWQQAMNLPMPHLQLGLIVKSAERPPRKNCFTRTEIQCVLEQANQLEWLLISLSFDCGLRISELRNLRKNNLHEDCLTIIGKGNKRRFAYLQPETLRRLENWIKRQEIKGYFWPSPLQPEVPLAVCTLRTYMRAAFNRAGFSNFCPHDLRHSYATDLKKLGVSTRKIQAGLGHSTERVTEKYLSDLEGYDLRDLYEIKYQA